MSIAFTERPRERLRRLGPEALSGLELLVLLLGTGTRGLPVHELAGNLLLSFGSLRDLGQASLEELARYPGVGITKAARLLSALELGRRRDLERRLPVDRIRSAEDVFLRCGFRLRDCRQESLWVLHLDAKGGVRSEREVTRGLLDGSLVHPREIFGPALREAVASILLVHNHPSGDPSPSVEDIEVTGRLVRVGRLLGIPVVDHVVIGEDGFVSLAEWGLAGLGA